MKYDSLIPVLTKAIQENDYQIKLLKAANLSLAAKQAADVDAINDLRREIAALRQETHAH